MKIRQKNSLSLTEKERPYENLIILFIASGQSVRNPRGEHRNFAS